MTHRTASEILADNKAKLGAEFGEIYTHAHWEWCEIWMLWRQFENLFGRNSERVRLLNDSAGHFFGNVDKYFFQSVVLAVCRLSDLIKTGNKQNLTVHQFQLFMDTPQRASKMQELLQDVKIKTDFCRDWRNRLISHNDLELKLKKAKKLKPATRIGINDAIKALHAVFNYVSVEFKETELADSVITHNDDIKLLYMLFDGARARKEHLEKVKSGIYENKNYPDWLSHKNDVE